MKYIDTYRDSIRTLFNVVFFFLMLYICMQNLTYYIIPDVVFHTRVYIND